MPVKETVSMDELREQRDRLEMELEIAKYRADLIECNLRRLKAQNEFTEERAKLRP